MVAIYARGKILWIRYKYQGKQHCKSLKLLDNRDNRRQAEIIRLETAAKLKRKRQESFAGFVSLGTAYEEFILFKQGDTRNLDVYEAAIKHLIEFYRSDNISIGSVSLADLKELRNVLLKKKLSRNTVYTYFRHLKTFFSFCKDNGYVSHIPVPKISPGKIEKRTIPEETMHRILWYLRVHNYNQWLLIKLYYLTGFRKSELLNLKGEDIDLDRRIIYVNNTKENRIDKFPIYTQLYNLLSQIVISKGNLFNYSPNGLKFWNRMLGRLELTSLYSIHDIRRSFATRMAGKLMPYELNKLMRHKSMQTTLKFYADMDLDDIANKL